MADISASLKAISGDLRKAQNAFFSRKFDEALELADAIGKAIEAAKAQDPESVQLKSNENKFAKLCKDLEARTGKKIAASAEPAAPAAEAPAARAPAEAAPPPPPPPPSQPSVADLLKTVSSGLRKAQDAFFNRRFDEALALADEVATAVESAKAQDPTNVMVTSKENQLAKLRKDVASRTGKAAPAPPPRPAPSTPAAKAPTATPAAAKPEQPAKLPAGVEKRLRDARDLIERRGGLDRAAELLGDIDRSYAGQFDPADAEYVAVKQLLEEARAEQAEAERAKKAEAEAKAQQLETMRSQSGEWEKKLRAFAPYGSPSFGNNTESVPDLLEQADAYEQALPVWEAFRAEEFPAGKTDELIRLETEIEPAIAEFPSFLEQMKTRRFDEALAHLRSRLEALGQEIEGKPSTLGARSLAEAEERLAKVQPLFAADSSQWTTLTATLDELKAKDAANRAARAKLTFIRPDAYSGDDVPQIKERAERFVTEADPAAELLKTTVYSEDWKELSQWEDYAGKQRFVTRREIYAQVAAKHAGPCRLHTIYITKEQRNDGTWSALTGNVMFTDAIDEANVNQ